MLKINRLTLAALGAVASMGVAIPASAIDVFALTDENDLLRFDSTTPEDLDAAFAISGLGGQDLIGIDFRPSNGLLYGVGNLGGIFTINTTNGNATLVSTLNVALDGSRFGVDFNPVPDLLRIVSNTDQNLRVDVSNGATTVDGNLAYDAGDPNAGDNPNVTAAAYTNNDNDPNTGTTLYDIDVRSNEDRLVIQNPPNAGTLNTVGPLGINAASLTGFDIGFQNGVNTGFAALQLVPNGISQLYTVNLGTGATTFIGDIEGGDLIDGLAVVIPEPTTAGLAALAGLGLLGRRRR